MLNATPGHVSDVEQTVQTIKVNKCSVIRDVFNLSAAAITRLDVFEEAAALLNALFFD